MALSGESLAQVRFSGRQRTRPQHAVSSRRLTLQRRVHLPEPLRDAEREFISGIFQRFGLNVDDYRARPLRRRLAASLRCMRTSRWHAEFAATGEIRRIAENVLSTLLIGYTTPFRDPSVFQRLRTDVLPRLCAERPNLRVWSAASSSGDEIFSLALLLAELRRLETSTLRASDSRAAAFDRVATNAGTFWDRIPAPFETLKQGVSKSLFLDNLRRVEWTVENVLHADYEREFDLVFCRNLAIYLEAPAADRLWQVMQRALAPNGVVVTGKAEKPLPQRYWRRIDHCIYEAIR